MEQEKAAAKVSVRSRLLSFLQWLARIEHFVLDCWGSVVSTLPRRMTLSLCASCLARMQTCSLTRVRARCLSVLRCCFCEQRAEEERKRRAVADDHAAAQRLARQEENDRRVAQQ